MSFDPDEDDLDLAIARELGASRNIQQLQQMNTAEKELQNQLASHKAYNNKWQATPAVRSRQARRAKAKLQALEHGVADECVALPNSLNDMDLDDQMSTTTNNSGSTHSLNYDADFDSSSSGNICDNRHTRRRRFRKNVNGTPGLNFQSTGDSDHSFACSSDSTAADSALSNFSTMYKQRHTEFSEQPNLPPLNLGQVTLPPIPGVSAPAYVSRGRTLRAQRARGMLMALRAQRRSGYY
ncbi:uncharacterized protein [Atheta coriaria]|uniref:uncharacterized protein n=1 Tax=Dalotia coriaria TaxID=877792 RepID=UPI0031F3D173